MLRRQDSTWVICIEDDAVVLTIDEQPHRGAKLTLPGGKVEVADDSTLLAAQRELREETGITCSDWRLVDCVQPNAKMEWFYYTYVAFGDLRKGELLHDPGERITTKRVGFDELVALAASKHGDTQFIAHILSHAVSIDDLRNLPEFKGKQISR